MKKTPITLEIEELEERIAPHAWLGGGHSPVFAHGGMLALPNGNEVLLPEQGYAGVTSNGGPPIDPPGNANGRA
jgi:hypothetical protein